MSEQLTPTNKPVFNSEQVATWVRASDLLTEATINRANDVPESVTVTDIVSKRTFDDEGKPVVVPTVVFNDANGISSEAETSTFMNWMGVTEEDIDIMSAESDIDRRLETAEFAGEIVTTEVVETKPQLTYEQREEIRLRDLFAPPKTIDQEPKQEESYDHLFMPDGPERDAAMQAFSRKSDIRARERLEYADLTAESRDEAGKRLSEAVLRDSKLADIISGFEGSNKLDRLSLVDAVRTDANLRYDIGTYFLKDKLPQLARILPDRVIGNGQKRPNHNGYSRHNYLTSREYAVMLALAMIDGTYQEPGSGDPIIRDNDGIATLGQHRFTAKALIESN